MKYKQLLYGQFCALKYNIALRGSYFPSHGFLVCCSIVILLMYKVLSIVLFELFKAIVCVWCGSAGNNKVVRWCSGGVVVCKVINRVLIILLVWIILWIELWMVGK